MIECWRWFGPDDPTMLDDLPQVGATGVVTALHQFAPGVEWPLQAVAERKAMIDAAGLTWQVVESLPVSEAIKTQGPEMSAHLAAYKASFRTLAEVGVRTICYNFMPILDWTRTQTRQEQPHGGSAMFFDLVDFAAFDLFILKRSGAPIDYPAAVREAARQAFDQMSDAEMQRLTRTVIAGLPGANDGWHLDDV
ncbi:MAG: mannonate dehydratase, partial [Pseudomonadota bacterium]